MKIHTSNKFWLYLASILLFFVVVNLTSYFENYFISIKNQEQQNVSNENNSNTKNTDITLEGLNRFTEALSEETIGLSSIDGRVYYVKL